MNSILSGAIASPQVAKTTKQEIKVEPVKTPEPAKVSDQPRTNKLIPTTNAERFNELAKENNMLNTLKNKFDLTTDI